VDSFFNQMDSARLRELLATRLLRTSGRSMKISAFRCLFSPTVLSASAANFWSASTVASPLNYIASGFSFRRTRLSPFLASVPGMVPDCRSPRFLKWVFSIVCGGESIVQSLISREELCG